MKVSIENVTNGWILSYKQQYEESEEYYTVKEVFSYDIINGDEEEKYIALQKLLYSLNEFVGIPFSKHKDYNIDIDIETNPEIE